MLFELVMEALNSLVRLAHKRDLFQLLPSAIKHRLSLYAGDLVVFLTPTIDDMQAMRTILES
jgi:hypothetical protein